MNWHPYATEYPMLESSEYEEFRADIAASNGPKCPIFYRLVNGGQKEYLDGRNRAKACEDLQLPCPELRLVVPDEEVKQCIDSLNLHRRHLTIEWLKKKRAERVERVAKARKEGQREQAA